MESHRLFVISATQFIVEISVELEGVIMCEHFRCKMQLRVAENHTAQTTVRIRFGVDFLKEVPMYKLIEK
jgi:hypothetical protein